MNSVHPAKASAADLRRAADRHVLHSVERGRGDRRLVFARGEGSRLWDVDGKEYLDAVSGTNGVALVGHGNPEVHEAIVAQLERLTDHFYVYDSPPVIELAQRLARIAPGELDKSIFCPGGGAGIEAAVKMAMKLTGRSEVVTLSGAYHGLGLATRGLLGLPALRAGMPEANWWPTFRHGPVPDSYRHRPGGKDPSGHRASLAGLDEAMGGGNSVAALIVEPVQGPGGHVVFEPDWFADVQALCRQHGTLLIADEVQTGLGRCGENFACDIYGIEPDVLVLAKGLGGGLPFGATMVSGQRVPPELEREAWIAFTFQNQPVAAAAALAVLEIVERDRLAERARVLGDRASSRFADMQDRFSCIGDVRGPGLFIGVDLVTDRETREPATHACERALEYALDVGLLTWFGGPGGNVLKLKPPLTTSDEDFEEMLDRIESVIAFVGRSI